MNLLIGSLTVGLILSLLALGVYISFRIFDFPDITADGSITLGAAVSAVCLISGQSPLTAVMAGALAGVAAGAVTGILHTVFKIHSLLSGILVMTALYSVNLRIMGRSNIPLLDSNTFVKKAETLAVQSFGGATSIHLWGWEIMIRDIAALGAVTIIIVAACMATYYFFRTNLGSAMRATGDNSQMIRALGVNTGAMIVIGIALSNGLVAASGALLAQYQGFADVQMGIGMVVWGLASVIIGETLVGTRKLGLTILGTVMGAVLFRLLVAIALRWGLDPCDLKLITAVFVFAALVLPGAIDRIMRRKKAPSHA